MTLNDIMEFDHVVEILPDGSVVDGPKGLYAPELTGNVYRDGEHLDCPFHNGQRVPWKFFTHGYSGQDSYSGPVMHDSEFIGGRLERDMLAQPGYYVAVICTWMPEEGEDDGECDLEGWAVAYLDKEDWTC